MAEESKEIQLIKIEAVVRDEMFVDVKNALTSIGVNGITAYQVVGCGVQRGMSEYIRGQKVDVQVLPKIKFEIVVSSEEWERKTIEAIKKAAFTGNPGDGKIFSYYIKQAIKIRTGETGYDAIQSPNFDD
ncbi:MAG: P-II family nitrogen regulator [Ruminococcus sp.]|nr:P-II family nitrogen regulator [Ruminococcus sp.]